MLTVVELLLGVFNANCSKLAENPCLIRARLLQSSAENQIVIDKSAMLFF